MKVIIKRPWDNAGEICEIGNDLNDLQEVVGGYVEAVRFCKEKNKIFWVLCDEDGKIKGSEYNCSVFCNDRFCDFAGTICIVGLKKGEFSDVPDWLTIDEWKKFIKMPDKILK